MTTTPPSIRSGNTVTAQYNVAQSETPPKQLTGKDVQVLRALQEQFPFFDAENFGVKTEKGKAEKPPVHSEGGKGSSSVKDFFKGIGQAIKSGFDKIGDFFKSFGKKEAETPANTTTTGTTTPKTTGTETTTPTSSTTTTVIEDEVPTPLTRYADTTRYGDSNVPHPDIERPNVHKAGGHLAFAYVDGGAEGLSQMVGGLAKNLMTEHLKSPSYIPMDKFVADRLSFTSDLGYALEGQIGADIKELIPQMKVEFAENPMALAVLDAIDKFDFNATLKSDFTKQIDGLKSPSNPLGSFLRSNNSVSLGLVALARSEGFDQNAVANSILTPHMKEMEALDSSLKKLPPELQKKEVLTGENATKMMDLTKTILMESLKTDGPNSLQAMFGQEHIDRLNDMANEIAQRQDLPKDVRNKAIETIYVDQLFLRGTMTALTNTVGRGTVEFTAVQLAQSILNGAGGSKFPSEDMRNAYTNVAQDFRQNFVQAMITLGMPVVQ